MINVNSVMSALGTIISSDSTLVNSGVSVEVSEVFNTDPNRTPWVGVYYGSTEIDPHRVGSQAPWRATHELWIFCQEHSHKSGEDASDLLDRLMFPVLSAVNSDKNLSGSVNIVTGFEVVPFDRDIQDEEWMFTNQVILRAITDV